MSAPANLSQRVLGPLGAGQVVDIVHLRSGRVTGLSLQLRARIAATVAQQWQEKHEGHISRDRVLIQRLFAQFLKGFTGGQPSSQHCVVRAGGCRLGSLSYLRAAPNCRA